MRRANTDNPASIYSLELMNLRSTQDMSTDNWDEVVKSLSNLDFRAEILVEEVPAPARLAPHSFALALDVVDANDNELANGRFVVLYDPDGQETWNGDIRIVTFVRASIENDVVTDEIFDDVAWSWLVEALTESEHGFHNISGTVTRTISKSYAGIEDRQAETDVEVRASWTPNSFNVGEQLQSWLNFVERAAGLTPLPPGVTSLSRNR